MFFTTNQHQRNRRRTRRRGAVMILAALLCIVLMGMIAFAVDVGFVLSSKEELQRAADAAAMAACWEYAQELTEGNSSETAMSTGRATAAQYAGINEVTHKASAIDPNANNTPDGDVVFGYISDLYDPNATIDTTQPNKNNVTQVRLRRDGTINDEIPFFFARVFGLTGQDLTAQATAAIVRDVRGFRTPHNGGNLGILPIALDLYTYNEWKNGNADDEWTWDPETETITPGDDGNLEINLYPQDTGAPGNRGMVDIGSSNNSTNDIARQIVEGVSPQDMEYHNGELKFDANGELFLNGDTGISAGVKDELASIKGQPRVIPVFAEVNGPGNNAQYTIVKWFGIRILDVKLTGPMNKKRVTIQAAPMLTEGIIPSTETGSSDYVYSPVVLLQ